MKLNKTKFTKTKIMVVVTTVFGLAGALGSTLLTPGQRDQITNLIAGLLAAFL